LVIVADEGQAYGYRKLTIALQREQRLLINKKNVYRLCDELDLLRPQRQIKPKHPRKIAVNREVTDSNQLWDRHQVRLCRGRRAILLLALDSRRI
jgi:putative transposase